MFFDGLDWCFLDISLKLVDRNDLAWFFVTPVEVRHEVGYNLAPQVKLINTDTECVVES